MYSGPRLAVVDRNPRKGADVDFVFAKDGDLQSSISIAFARAI